MSLIYIKVITYLSPKCGDRRDMENSLAKTKIKLITLGAAVIPAVLMFLLLTPYLIYERTEDAQQALQKQGDLLVSQLSHVSEFALISGNSQYLDDIINNLFRQSEIQRITVWDSQGDVVIRRINTNGSKNGGSLIEFEGSVYKQVEDPSTFNIVDGFPFASSDSDEVILPNENRMLGKVKVELSTSDIKAQRIEIVLHGILLATVALMISGYVGLVLGKKISKPIQYVIDGVKRIRKEDFSTPIGEVSDNEIGSLARDIDNLATELSHLKQINERQIIELTKARDFADKASASKSDFLALISHEIRSPLNSAYGVLQILEDSSLNPAQRRYVTLALASCQHLVSLLDDIIDFSTLDYGEMKIENSPVKIKYVVEQVVSSFRDTADKKELALNVEFSGDVSLQNGKYLCDETRLRQILTNLVDNAVKYTNKGGISVRVNWFQCNDQQIRFSCTVQDSGIGIPKDKLKSIFEMFNQAAAPETRSYGGVGLGLYIVKKLANLMAGEIQVTSQRGVGSTFIYEQILMAAPDSTEFDGIAGSEPVVNEKNILVIEDDSANQQVLCGLLAHMGVAVDVANSGMEGLQLFRKNEYDLVFLDCFMPEQDGFEVAKKIREEEAVYAKRHVPIVALTASALPETRKRCFESGMDDFIAKPYKKFEIYKRILAARKTKAFLNELKSPR